MALAGQTCYDKGNLGIGEERMPSADRLGALWRLMLAVVVTVGLMACGTMEQRRDKFMAQGKAAFEKGDFIAARLHFKNALQLDPKLAAGYLWLGKTELRLQNPREAFGALTQAVELDPGALEAQLLLGNLLLAGRRVDEAAAKADMVLEKEPQNLEALMLAAGVAAARQQPEKALATLAEVRRLDPRKIEAYVLAAAILSQQKEWDKIAALLEEGLKANPDNLTLQVNRARLAMEQKQFEVAALYLDRAQEAAPQDPRVYEEQVRLYMQQQQWDKAEGALRKKMELEPDKEAHVTALAQFLARQGRWEEGEKLFQDFLSRHPQNLGAKYSLVNYYLAHRRTGKGMALLREIGAAEPGGPTGIKAKGQLAALYLGQGRREEAEKLAKEVLQVSPKDPVALKLEGLLALTKGDGLKAVNTFRQLTRDLPQEAENWLLLARAHQLNKEETLAREAAKKAIELRPDYREAKDFLYRTYLAKKDLDGLVEVLKEYLRTNERDLQTLAYLGDLYLLKGNPKEAQATYQKMVAADPKNPQGYMKLAMLSRTLQQPQAAMQYLEKALKENPQAFPAVRLLVALHLEQKEPQKALERVRALEAKYPKSDELKQILGEVLLALKQPEAAAKALEESLTLNPRDAQALAFLVRAYEGMWGTAEARQKLAEKAGKPESPPFYALALAQVYERQKEWDKAIALYEELLARQVASPVVKNNLAYLLAEHRPGGENLARARELLSSVLEDNPEDPHLLDTLGWILCKQDDLIQAKEFLTRAASRLPEHPVLQYHLGYCLAKLKEYEPAREALAKAVAAKGDFPERAAAQKLLDSLPPPAPKSGSQ